MEREPWYVIFRRELALWAILIGGGAFGAFFLAVMVHNTWFAPDAWMMKVAREHYPAVIGLPLMAIAALLIVSAFRITSGDLEFELFGLRLRGAAGPVVLWVIVFLAMVLGVMVLWERTTL